MGKAKQLRKAKDKDLTLLISLDVKFRKSFPQVPEPAPLKEDHGNMNPAGQNNALE